MWFNKEGMMNKRIVKDPQERKREIIEVAFELFQNNGFAETSVSQIVKKVGIAQGTFYYHFKSKNAVLYEIIYKRYINELIEQIRPLSENKELSALEKLKKISDKEMEIALERLPGITRIKNSDLVRRIFSHSVKKYVPLVAEVIQQGVEEGCFDTPYPLESCAMFHVSNMFFFHPGICTWSEDELKNNLKAAIYIMERGYGAAQGSLDFYYEALKSIQRNLKESNYD